MHVVSQGHELSCLAEDQAQRMAISEANKTIAEKHLDDARKLAARLEEDLIAVRMQLREAKAASDAHRQAWQDALDEKTKLLRMLADNRKCIQELEV